MNVVPELWASCSLAAAAAGLGLVTRNSSPSQAPAAAAQSGHSYWHGSTRPARSGGWGPSTDSNAAAARPASGRRPRPRPGAAAGPGASPRSASWQVIGPGQLKQISPCTCKSCLWVHTTHMHVRYAFIRTIRTYTEYTYI